MPNVKEKTMTEEIVTDNKECRVCLFSDKPLCPTCRHCPDCGCSCHVN